MALNRSQILQLYQVEVAPETVSQRIEQMYNLLTVAQKNVVWPVVKSDLTAALNADKTSLVSQKDAANLRFDTSIADIDSKLADIAASVP